MANFQREFTAILLRTDRNAKDHLYCDEDGRPLLWDRHSIEARKVYDGLQANKVPSSLIDVIVKTKGEN